MSAFDWKSVLLAKHAQHVVLIHFPIALFIAAVVFDVLALRLQRRELEKWLITTCWERPFSRCRRC